MSYFALVKALASIPKITYDDDFTDRLSNRYTVGLICVFAVSMGISHIGGTKISCWAPVHFTKSHKSYMNSFCWVRNTYYLPWDERVPKVEEERDEIPYYQWIPLILLTQAALFYLPSILWHGLNQKSGVDADNILTAASNFNQMKNIKKKDDRLKIMVNQFNRFLGKREKLGAGQESSLNRVKSVLNRCCCFGPGFGSYLVFLYLLTKILYIANVFFQLYMLSHLLDTNFTFYGIQVLSWIINDDVNQWTTSPHVAFPRVTFCDFRVRRLGNVHRYTVQCTLPINLYNEKIYMFMWFWMVFVGAVTVISLLQWGYRAFSVGDRVSYIKNHVKAGEAVERFEIQANPQAQGSASQKQDNYAANSDIEAFVKNYLRMDGVFLLRLIGHNTNNITVTEIIMALWQAYINDRNKKSNPNMDDNENDTPMPKNPDEADKLPPKTAPPPDSDDEDIKKPLVDTHP